ncbi:retron St85 family RNA-directed DNA polymerase [Vibrio cholerae]|uniref:retron St85 family RNA-directed DNA polymerase n=1 Tax=Vibrio cholerae TaxID=666 RepID=UPI000BA8FAAC|nr:retron St85 family RNA-directed DNA polymerase [Vibrio cholerae]EGQ9107117.1 RNA-directed DNA polymerase [Vibrio cholerae]EGR0262252.1 RNA-directed DNA polymerase [Vibrio cholerae]EGR0494736.1 RNA-directed DNA polymerase [Vibrio cholerae]EGR0890177.1 RNA-directed DNA polymerase [Vibrio cholerae]EHD2261300.1 RNA-directed DNA polymerase [Vibrio cholerae]
MDLKLYQYLESRNSNFTNLLRAIPSKHYKVYKIPKKRLGFRTIAQPTPAVKVIQKQIVDYLIPKTSIHTSALAYVSGKGVKDNALQHVKSDYLLKVDLENFFNSITPKMLVKALKHQGIDVSETDIMVLSQFLFWNITKKANGKLVLSIGAPSSPFVSNLVMFAFDQRMSKLCRSRDITYTRYADDLTFSTTHKNILFQHLNEVRKVLKKEFGARLVLNESKTVFSSKAHNRHVTGVTLTNNNKISLGRDKKRYISSLIHKFKLGLLEQEDIYHLQGLISYAKHIEVRFLHKMSSKYGANVLDLIRKYSGEDDA